MMSSNVKNRPFRVILLVALAIQSFWIACQQYTRNRQSRWMADFEEVSQSISAVVGISSTTDYERRELDNGPSQQSSQDSTKYPFSSVCEWAAPKNPINLWTEHLPTILAASRLSKDEDYTLQGITARILQEATMRLPRSVKTIPTTDISHVMEKLERRYRYLLDPDSFVDKPPPVIITILGGSVTSGNNCYTGIKGLQEKHCAWPIRLQQFIDALVQFTLPNTTTTSSSSSENLVTVQSLATGATNTAIGRMVIEFDLWPEVPDILINSYSTNDNHEQTIEQAAKANVTLRDQAFTMSQDFVRTLYQQGQCSNKTIILYYLDDYIGNVQRSILVNYELAQSLHVLSNYYGFGFLSYADAVRDAVYSNTREKTFTPAQWYDESNLAAGMKQQVHPGQGMHMVTAWIIAYNLFSAMVTHCGMESYKVKMQKGANSDGATADQTNRRATPLPIAVRTPGMPPPLTKNLTLDVVSELWRLAASTAPDCGVVGSGSAAKRCPVSWVSGMPHRDDTWIKGYFETVVQSPYEWDVIDDTTKGKFGWMPMAGISNPKLVMKFDAADHAANNIRSVTLFFLKSYGPKWKGSTATVTIERMVQNEWVPAAAAVSELSGTHDLKTSENYAETVHLLKNEAVASAIRLTLTHTGGETFKLMGVAICQ
jgi:hypothetical protein